METKIDFTHETLIMATREEIKNYYLELRRNFETKSPIFQYNKDRAHNSVVLRLMLDTSTSIKMYCGQLSVMRKGFYEHIKNEDEILADELQSKLKESFEHFITKDNSKLIIILETYKDEYLKDLIYGDDFKRGLKNGKIELLKLNDKLTFKQQLYHFSLSDTMIVRIEQDKEQHSAVCSLNQKDIYDSVNNVFNKIEAIAEKAIC